MTRRKLTFNQIIGRGDVIKPRFTSLQFQLNALVGLGDDVSRILEVGPGRGYFRVMAKLLGYEVLTLDRNPENNPDYNDDISELDVPEQFDAVLAFEVLEHMPYPTALNFFESMRDLSNRYVVLSVPTVRHTLSLRLRLPNMVTRRRFGTWWLRGGRELGIRWGWPRPADQPEVTQEDHWNPHHWEMGRKSYPTKKVLKDLTSRGVKLVRQFTNPEHDYHEFLIFEIEPKRTGS